MVIRTEEKVIATEEREEIKDNKLQELKIETTKRNKKDSHDIETEAKQEWKKYKSRKLTPGTKDTNDVENEIKNNQYKVLVEEVDDKAEEYEAIDEDIKRNNKEAAEIKTMEKCFDVEAMTMNEIEEVIKEYKEEDVVVDELEVEDKRVVERYREVSDDESCCTNGSEIEILDAEEDDERNNESDVDMNEVYELVKGQEEELQQKIAEIKMKETTIKMLIK